MQGFGSFFRFFVQFMAVVLLLLLEYPLGSPIFSLSVVMLWFTQKGWMEKVFFSILFSLAIALLYPLSWFIVCSFLLIGFQVVQRILRQGWPIAVVGLFVFVVAAVGSEFALESSTISGLLLWRALWLLLLVFIVSATARRQVRQILLPKKRHA